MIELFFLLFSAHLTEGVKNQLKSENIQIAILPGGTTSRAQPLDVLVNRAFKKELRDKWSTWMRKQRVETSSTSIKPPGRGVVATWVSEAWESIPSSLIETSFVSAGLFPASQQDPQPSPTQGDLTQPDLELEGHDIFTPPATMLHYDDEIVLAMGQVGLEE